MPFGFVQGVKERYLPEFVYGSIDGLVTTFAIVSGVMGAQLPIATILVLGVANVFADGFSMGSSAYLSARSEEGLRVRAVGKTPFAKASATFVAFVGIGFIPLSPFLITAVWPNTVTDAFVWSIVITGLAFFGVGYAEGLVVKKHRLRTAATTFFIGSMAAAIAFLVGYLLRGFA